MRFYILLMACLLAASASWAKPELTPLSMKEVYGHSLVFRQGDLTESEPLSVSGLCSIAASIAGSDVISIYQVPYKTTAATSGSLVKTFTANQTVSHTFAPGNYYVKAISTTATTGGSGMRIQCSNAQLSSSGSVNIDADGNGLYEVAGIQDWDGDGSAYEVCTAKDTPAPQCKVAGEIIYRDFIDDANYLIHHLGDQEVTINLRGGVVYTGIGCWNAGAPTRNLHNDPLTHDTTGDASYADCVVDENDEELWTLAVRNKKVRIIGQGRDERYNDTTSMAARGSGRTVGTTIAVDGGGFYADWFGKTSQNAYISTGQLFTASLPAAANTGTGSNPIATGTARGLGVLTQDESINAAVHRGSVCVSNVSASATATGWVQTMVAGDRAYVVIPQTDLTAVSAGVEVRIAGFAGSNGGNCTDANSREVYLGPKLDSGGAGTVGPAWGEVDDNDGLGTGYLLVPDENYWNSSFTMTGVTIEPQDWIGESGGDCSESGLWDFTSAIGGTLDADLDCDSNPMWIGYQGRIRITDTLFKHGMSYSIDGGLVPTDTILGPGIKWMYVSGEAIMDAGQNWKVEDTEVVNSSFKTDVFKVFGSYLTIRKIRITGSQWIQAVINFGGTDESGSHRGSYIDDVRIESSIAPNAFTFGCGARNNTIRYVRASGLDMGHDGGTTSTGDALFKFYCTNSANPAIHNDISDVHVDPPGYHINFTGGTDTYMSRMVLWDALATADANYGNSFSNFRMSGTAAINANSCMFNLYATGADAASRTALRKIATHNTFINNYVEKGLVMCWAQSGQPNPPSALIDFGLAMSGAGNLEGSTGLARTDPMSMNAATGGGRMLIGDADVALMDTGTKVCNSAGLVCLTSVEPATGADVDCGTTPTGTVTNHYFYALCAGGL